MFDSEAESSNSPKLAKVFGEVVDNQGYRFGVSKCLNSLLLLSNHILVQTGISLINWLGAANPIAHLGISPLKITRFEAIEQEQQNNRVQGQIEQINVDP